jgi:hypothetical protein
LGRRTIYSGQQQKKMANYQAAQAEADADAAKASARVEADRIRKAGRQQASAANAAWQRQVLRPEKERRCALRQELPETLNKMLSRRS